MSIQRRMSIQIINIVLACMLGVSILACIAIKTSISSTASTLHETIEDTWRSQARSTLNSLTQQLNMSCKSGTVDVLDDESLRKWCKLFLSSVRNGGVTCDGFMIVLGSEKFIWDGSPDCEKPSFLKNGRFMNDEVIIQKLAKEYLLKHNIPIYDTPVLRYADLKYLKSHYPKIYDYFITSGIVLHKNPKKAEEILNLMRLGFDTDEDDHYYWNFDGRPEYLEWKCVPAGDLGFNDEPRTIGGVKNPQYRQILIQLGTQKDEVEKPYNKIFKSLSTISTLINAWVTLAVLSYIVFMFWLIFYPNMIKKGKCREL